MMRVPTVRVWDRKLEKSSSDLILVDSILSNKLIRIVQVVCRYPRLMV